MKTKRRKAKRGQEWSLEDFVEDVSSTMQAQAKARPMLRQTHARISPEGKRTASLVHKLLATSDEEAQSHLIESIVDEGEVGTRILIDVLLTLRDKFTARERMEGS